MLFKLNNLSGEVREALSVSVIKMLVRVLRRLTLEEVETHIGELEKTFGMSFDEFEERLIATERDEGTSIDEYVRWAMLMHAYRGYLESGELHCVVEEVYDFSSKKLEAMTPRRLELLYALSNLWVESINDLARKVHRDVKNVYQDLQILKELGLVNMSQKKNGKIIPEALVEEITFMIQ